MQDMGSQLANCNLSYAGVGLWSAMDADWSSLNGHRVINNEGFLEVTDRTFKY